MTNYPDNQYNQYGYEQYPGNDPYGQYNNPQPSNQPPKRRFSLNFLPGNLTGLEKTTITLSVLALIGTFTWGYLSQGAKNRDFQRSIHIQNVIAAIDSFYDNSSTELAKKKYPISVCTSSLNAVDYEFTLKQHLTGQIPELDSHVYVNPGDFPNDPWGRYSTSLGEREVLYPCENLLPSGSDQIYSDDTESCNFSSIGQERFRKCYIYQSSSNGESYSIGYYSEQIGNFVVYQKYRNEDLRLVQ